MPMPFLSLKAPLETTWDTLFADATLASGARLPVDADYEERADAEAL